MEKPQDSHRTLQAAAGKEELSPLINWEALQKLSMPPRHRPPEHAPGDRDNMWDRTSKMYSRMTELEGKFTLDQLDCIPIGKEDTVLDACCGPGRISVPAAKRAKSVMGIDSSEKMLEYCRFHAKQAGIDNLETRLMDWNEVVPGENLPAYDIVIACRCLAMWELEKLSACANKYAVIVGWANAPSIPEILNDLFQGTTESQGFRPRPHTDRRVSYNAFFNRIYDMGYDPNCRILEDGYYASYDTRKAAYEDLKILSQQQIVDEERYHANIDRFLTENGDGTFTFYHATKSFVMWWDTRVKA